MQVYQFISLVFVQEKYLKLKQVAIAKQVTLPSLKNYSLLC